MFFSIQQTAIMQSIEGFNVDPPSGGPGRTIGRITLDETNFVERGEIASHRDSVPLVSTVVRVNLFWMGRRPLAGEGTQMHLRLATREVVCEVANPSDYRLRIGPTSGESVGSQEPGG